MSGDNVQLDQMVSADPFEIGSSDIAFDSIAVPTVSYDITTTDTFYNILLVATSASVAVTTASAAYTCPFDSNFNDGHNTFRHCQHISPRTGTVHTGGPGYITTLPRY